MAEQEGNPRLFTLSEAESARGEVEPLLIEAIERRRRMVGIERRLGALADRIQRRGGLLVRYANAAKLRRDYEQIAREIKAALEHIEATGCVVKDLDQGLIDFPARLDGEDVYWCWRLGENRIRFWHRPQEGFAGRKPIFPGDPGAGDLVQ
jgi:hypothetical protein